MTTDNVVLQNKVIAQSIGYQFAVAAVSATMLMRVVTHAAGAGLGYLVAGLDGATYGFLAVAAAEICHRTIHRETVNRTVSQGLEQFIERNWARFYSEWSAFRFEKNKMVEGSTYDTENKKVSSVNMSQPLKQAIIRAGFMAGFGITLPGYAFQGLRVAYSKLVTPGS